MRRLALLLRHPAAPWLVVAVLAVAHVAAGLLVVPGFAVAKYPQAAAQWRAGTLGADRLADFSPLYLWLNLWWTPPTLRALQSVAGGLAVVGSAIAGRRAGGTVGALGAALLAAACSPVLVHEAVLEPDLLILVLSLWALVALGAPQAGLLRLFAGGAALGLSSALRPTGLLFAAVSVAWIAATRRGRAERPWVGAMAVAAGTLVALTPVWVFQRQAGAATGGTMSVGAVLHMGHRPEGTGLGAQPPQVLKRHERQLRAAGGPDFAHELYRRYAAAAGGADAGFAAESYWIHRVLAFARHEPLRFAGLQLRKLGFYLLGPDAHDLGEARRLDRALAGLPLVPAEGVMVLGLAGFALAIWRRRWSLELGYALAALAIIAGFYFVARYRVAAMAGWWVLGAAWLGTLARSGREPRRFAGMLAVPGVAVVLLVALPFLRHGRAMMARAEELSDAGALLERQRAGGRLAEASETFVELQAIQPYVTWVRDLRGVPFEARELARASGGVALERFEGAGPVPMLLLAELADRAGDCEKALAPAAVAMDAGYWTTVFDQLVEPRLMRARCLRQLGRTAEAREELRQAVAALPGTLDGLSEWIASGAAPVGAEPELFALHDPVSAHLALARAHNAWGRADEALGHAAWVLERFELGEAWYERARAEAALGRARDAVHSYAKAVETFPAFAYPTLPLQGAVDEALRQGPTDPEVLTLAAEHALRQGRIADARALHAAATAAFGSTGPPAHVERARFLSRAQPPPVVTTP